MSTRNFFKWPRKFFFNLSWLFRCSSSHHWLSQHPITLDQQGWLWHRTLCSHCRGYWHLKTVLIAEARVSPWPDMALLLPGLVGSSMCVPVTLAVMSWTGAQHDAGGRGLSGFISPCSVKKCIDWGELCINFKKGITPLFGSCPCSPQLFHLTAGMEPSRDSCARHLLPAKPKMVSLSEES